VAPSPLAPVSRRHSVPRAFLSSWSGASRAPLHPATGPGDTPVSYGWTYEPIWPANRPLVTRPRAPSRISLVPALHLANKCCRQANRTDRRLDRSSLPPGPRNPGSQYAKDLFQRQACCCNAKRKEPAPCTQMMTEQKRCRSTELTWIEFASTSRQYTGEHGEGKAGALQLGCPAQAVGTERYTYLYNRRRPQGLVGAGRKSGRQPAEIRSQASDAGRWGRMRHLLT